MFFLHANTHTSTDVDSHAHPDCSPEPNSYAYPHSDANSYAHRDCSPQPNSDANSYSDTVCYSGRRSRKWQYCRR